MGAAERRLALLLLLAVAASRLLAVPGVPWEQDEALFAAAAFDTDLVQHRPHPPGFPLWVAASKAGLALAGDPVRALQVLSALASTAAAWALLATLSPLLGARLAIAAAAWWAFLPGVWFHAPRAFTSTPATALALAAVAVWRRPGRAAWLGGTALLAAAVLVRPVLAPPLLALALAAAWLRRERPARVAAAAGLGALLVTAGFAPLVADTGGLGPYLAALAGHGAGHAGALHLAPWRLAGLGPVRAVGGPLPAAVLLVLALVGAGALTTRLRTAWLGVTAVTLAWLLLAHNRTYPRYAVPAMALLVPAAAAGLRRLEPRAAAALAAAAAAAAAVQAGPAVAAQARAPFPPLEAIAAAREAGFVVVDGGLSPFGDLLNLARRTRAPVVWRPLVAQGRIRVERLRGGLAFVWAEPTPRRWIAPPLAPARTHRAPRALAALAQGRYLEAHLGRGGAVVLAPEGAHAGAAGLPLDTPVELLVPPTGHGDRLALALEASAGAAVRLERVGTGDVLARDLPAGPSTVWARLPRIPHAWRLRVAAAGGAVRLLRCWREDAFRGYGRLVVPARELRPGGLEGLVGARGLWGIERLGEPPREGRWTRATATLELPLAPGAVAVELAAPRPGPVAVTLQVPPGGTVVRVEVGPSWRRVEVPVPARHDRRLVIAVDPPFVPGRHDPRSRDTRELGVVVGRVEVGLTSPRP